MGVVSALVGGATALLGGGGGGTKKAAQAQVQGAQIAADVQRDIYGKNEGYLSPLVQAGRPATDRLNAMLGLSGQPAQQQAFGAFGDYLDQSGYAFDLGRGLNAVNSGYAGKGMIKSGAAMKGIEDYRQGLQQQYLGNYMGALGNQQGVGLSAGSALAGVGTNFANAMGNIEQNKADALSNAALVRSQNNSNNLNSLLGFAGSIFGGR